MQTTIRTRTGALQLAAALAAALALAATGAAAAAGTGGASAAAAGTTVRTYYADLANRDYSGACALVAPAWTRELGMAVLRGSFGNAAATAAISAPSLAHCARLLATVTTLDGVEVAQDRTATITATRVSGTVATITVARAAGAGGSRVQDTVTTSLAAHGWLITRIVAS